MGTPRLPTGYEGGTLWFGTAPSPFRETVWPVHQRYWLEDREGWETHEAFPPRDEDTFWSSDLPLLAHEDYEHKGRYDLAVRFPKGTYICWSNSWAKTYNPVMDAPDLFLKFAALGKSSEPDTTRILEFVSKYGILKLREKTLYGEISFSGAYPLSAFKSYAREAYLILRLYKALSRKDDREVRLWLKKYVQTLPEEIWCFEEAIGWREFLSWWWPRLPASFRDKAVGGCELEARRVLTEDAKEVRDKLRRGDWVAGRIVQVSEGFWSIFFEEGPSQAVFEAAALLIATTVSLRTGSGTWFSVDPIFPEENKEKRYDFRLEWGTPSLLKTIWLLFALKITGQLEQEYRICPVCEEPIVAPRRNQTYHQGCRQIHHNRLKRAVQRLWREGKPVEEIAEETGATLAQVKRWTEGRSQSGS